ncbi:MAG: hypothetical protein MJE77_40755 [Proteobacteria bacterium]|nr:hypothetical protein [Pseudomonadota bacterium]
MSQISVSSIAWMLDLPTHSGRNISRDAVRGCEHYLLERRLSVAPIVRPIMDAGRIPAATQRHIITSLRLFRAAVRGLDDLLDHSDADPAGRDAAWRVHGPVATVRAALGLWQRAIAMQSHPFARRIMLAESGRMVRAARLEEMVCRSAGEMVAPVRTLAAIEHRIRDKEWAYWRLIAGLLRVQWRAAPKRWARFAELLHRLSDNWQRADDTRDFAADVADGRLSSFIVDVLRGMPDMFSGAEWASASARPHLYTRSWPARLDTLADRYGARIECHRAWLYRHWSREQARILAAIRHSAGLRYFRW